MTNADYACFRCSPQIYLTINVYPCFVLKPKFTRVTTEDDVFLITRQSPS